MNSTLHRSARQEGFSMIEVLVTVVILLVGLMGLAGLMAQSQRSEMESYQRVQAMILLQDMAARINANRLAGAACYAFTPTAGTPYLGTGSTLANPTVTAGTLPGCSSANIIANFTSQLNVALPVATYAQDNAAALARATASAPTAALTAVADLNAWNTAMLGAAETAGGSNVGAITGARGCISYDPTQLINTLSGNPIPGSGVYTIAIAWQGVGDTFANTTSQCGVGQYGAETRRRVATLTFRIGSVTNSM